MKTISQLKNKTIKSVQTERTTKRGRSFLLIKFIDGDFFSIATKTDFNLYSDDASIKMNHTTTIDCDYSSSSNVIGSTIDYNQISTLDSTTPIGKRKVCHSFTIFTNKGATNFTIQSKRIPEITDYELEFFFNGQKVTPEELIQQ